MCYTISHAHTTEREGRGYLAVISRRLTGALTSSELPTTQITVTTTSVVKPQQSLTPTGNRILHVYNIAYKVSENVLLYKKKIFKTIIA